MDRSKLRALMNTRRVGLQFEHLEPRCVLSVTPPLAFDTAFSGDGQLSSSGLTQDLAVGTDGSVFVVGLTTSSPFDFQVRKYTPSGSVDNSFGGGVVTTDFQGSSDRAYSVAIQGDGKLLVAGSAVVDGVQQPAVVRYLTNGDLDTSFGDGGKRLIELPTSAEAEGVGVQSTGKIVVLGNRFELTRLNEDGSLDESFGNAGTAVAPGSFLRAGTFEVLLDDAVLIVGTRFGGNSSSSIAVARVLADGDLDTNFSSNGVASINVPGEFDGGLDATEQSDGAILVAGFTSRRSLFPPENDLVLARLMPTGIPDPSFGLNGTVTLPMSAEDDAGAAVLQLANGKILVATNSATGPKAIARFQPDGRLDTVLETSSSGATGTSQLVQDEQGRVVGLLYNGLQTGGQVVRLVADDSPATGEVGGTVWHDRDGDGTRSADVPLIVGSTIFVDLNANGELDPNEPQATTDENGIYRLGNLFPGDYVLRILAEVGVTTTTADLDNASMVTVAAGDTYRSPALDFEDLGHPGHTSNLPNYQRHGFVVSASASPGNKFNVSGPAADGLYAESATLRAPWIPNTITIARADGQPFDLESIDFAAGIFAFPGGMQELIGTRPDDTTVTTNVTTNQTSLERFATPEFTNITRVEWSVSGSGRPAQFDNIRVRVNDSLLGAQRDFGMHFSADFNHDARVDAADYTVWRDWMGSNVVPFAHGDANGDGLVDADDYDLWRVAFGAVSPFTSTETSFAVSTNLSLPLETAAPEEFIIPPLDAALADYTGESRWGHADIANRAFQSSSEDLRHLDLLNLYGSSQGPTQSETSTPLQATDRQAADKRQTVSRPPPTSSSNCTAAATGKAIFDR